MSNDPQAIGSLIPAHLKDRLERLAPNPVELEDGLARETPEEATQRRLRAQEGTRARWVRLLPPMYASASTEDLDGIHWPDGSLTLVLAGGVGVEKTHAAYAIANDLVAQGRVCEAWAVGDLLAALRPGQEAERADMWCRRADVLILDDLGATKVSEFAVEQMTLLVDDRIRHNRRTIVTTNLTETQLSDAWGERLMDRLRYRRTVVVLSGTSRRHPEF